MVFFLLIILLVGCNTYKFIHSPTSYTIKKKNQSIDTTEVIVLGTLHKKTQNVSFDSLYNALEKIKPNIILFEMDSTAFKNGHLKNSIYSIILPNFLSRYQPANLEEIACKKYCYFNPNSVILPYEWKNRNQFHKSKDYKFITKYFFQKIEGLSKAKKLNSKHQKIYDEFLGLTQKLNKYGDSCLYQINSKNLDSLAQKRQENHYQKLKIIVDENEDLAIFKNPFQKYSKYWDIRNKAMSENIVKVITENPNTRIVILNGYFHRYYLLKELKKQQTKNHFNIVEYYDLK